MCGICGYYSDDISPLLIRKMAERLKARGPDDEGFHFGKGICLGVRRLSIIDIEGGHQPFYNENRSICAIMNGEIYNFQDIKKELEGKGHLFNTHSDTEVLTHSYEEWGFDFVKKMRGMFAIAVWDENKKLLILVRDRLGIKPLYYASIGQGISFASEIKS
ncbi:MAG: asparagine synthetase B, partial [Candidatus Omnitrophica bacterium]|nr:asparagine synthetase B [Candidatus Omnitrophota bacterium]